MTEIVDVYPTPNTVIVWGPNNTVALTILSIIKRVDNNLRYSLWIISLGYVKFEKMKNIEWISE